MSKGFCGTKKPGTRAARGTVGKQYFWDAGNHPKTDGTNFLRGILLLPVNLTTGCVAPSIWPHGGGRREWVSPRIKNKQCAGSGG